MKAPLFDKEGLGEIFRLTLKTEILRTFYHSKSPLSPFLKGEVYEIFLALGL